MGIGSPSPHDGVWFVVIIIIIGIIEGEIEREGERERKKEMDPAVSYAI